MTAHSTPQYQKEWRKAHQGEIAAYNKAYRSAHRAAANEYIRNWKTTDPWRQAKAAVKNARDKAIKFGYAGGDLTKEVFARLHLLPCAYCGHMPALGVDHDIPLSKGGPNALHNLAPSCLPCNVRKGTKTVMEFTYTVQ